ncbi:MAG TPA: glycosyltransferase family 9 protein [Selenomonadales bacterium]|nr:glycosyltransferase family 9 protein [Selenomonadales bacterium]
MGKQILIIRLSSIGDVVHCTPVAASIKTAWPDAKVTWLVSEVSADVIRFNPDIDEIWIWSRERFEGYLRRREWKKAAQMWRSLGAQLSTRRFDAVLDIHGLLLTGLIARRVKTPRRIGLQGARELNPLFMTETAAPTGTKIVDRYLGVLKPLGIVPAVRRMRMVVPEEAALWAEGYLREAGPLDHDRLAVLVVGTTWPSKNWPPGFFATTARMLARDFTVVLCGGKSEADAAARIAAASGVPVVNAVGETSLLEMSALLNRAAVVITGDTGPLHIAAALGVPTVALFGPTDPALFNPEGRQHAFLVKRQACSHCHKQRCRAGKIDCMSSIEPAAVVRTAYAVSRGRTLPPADEKYPPRRPVVTRIQGEPD